MTRKIRYFSCLRAIFSRSFLEPDHEIRQILLEMMFSSNPIELKFQEETIPTHSEEFGAGKLKKVVEGGLILLPLAYRL